MSISPELCNFDVIFKQLKSKVHIVNDLAGISEKERQKLNDTISVTYNSDLMRSVSSCHCGDVEGEHRVGEICPNCTHECRPPIEDDLEPIVWVRAPVGVHALINPTVWIMISEYFTKGGHDIIRWLCDSSYKSKRKPIREIEMLEEMGVVRSYNWFVENFDKIMDILFDMTSKSKSKQSLRKASRSKDLAELLKTYRHCIFSKYLPIPNRTLLLIEKTNVGTYVDKAIVGAIDAINIIASIDHELCYLNDIKRQNRTAKMIVGLADYFKEFYKEFLSDKTGLARKNIYGSRANFTIRAVATSITAPHEHDEVHLSWGSGVGSLKYHIINKLIKMGFTSNECLGIVNKYSRKYSELLDSIMKGLIDESPNKGIPLTHGRNPSLYRGSVQALRATKIKTDPEDPTVSFSILIIAPMNADFDGRHLPYLNYP